MSKLQELIQELCPEGVEYSPLGEYIEIYTGVQFNKRDMLEVGTYPVLNGGIKPSGFTEKYNEQENTITISQGGASAGYVNWMNRKFWAGAHCFIVKPNINILNKRYLYFLLKNSEQALMQSKHGAGIPGLNRDKVRNLIIPIPPLPVQEEIVRILDYFTNLAAELQAELQARKEQYEYYRNKLLSFNNINGGGYRTDVTWMKMSEICKIYTGGEPPKDAIKGNYKDSMHPYPIWGNGKEVYGYASSYIIDKDATVISSIGANAGTVYFRKAYFTPIIRLKVLIPKSDNVLSKFLYFYLSTISLAVKSSSVPNMNANDVKKLLIPVPSLAEQQRIVSILDKFEVLVNDLTEGLPAEIAAVQEQYEYYRNKLLSFPKITAA